MDEVKVTCFNPFCPKVITATRLCCDKHWKDLPKKVQLGLFEAWVTDDWELINILRREINASARDRSR